MEINSCSRRTRLEEELRSMIVSALLLCGWYSIRMYCCICIGVDSSAGMLMPWPISKPPSMPVDASSEYVIRAHTVSGRCEIPSSGIKFALEARAGTECRPPAGGTAKNIISKSSSAFETTIAAYLDQCTTRQLRKGPSYAAGCFLLHMHGDAVPRYLSGC